MREGEVELQQAVQGTAVVVVVRAVFGIQEIAWLKGPHQEVQLLGRLTGISKSELSAFHCVYAKPQYRYGKSGVFPVKSVNWIYGQQRKGPRLAFQRNLSLLERIAVFAAVHRRLAIVPDFHQKSPACFCPEYDGIELEIQLPFSQPTAMSVEIIMGFFE